MQEDVCFMVIKNPFVNLTTNANQPYTLNLKVKYNFSYWPRVDDVILKGLTDGIIPAGTGVVHEEEMKEEMVQASFQSSSAFGSSGLKLSLGDRPLVPGDD